MNVNEAFNVLNISQSSATQTEIKKAYKTASLRFHLFNQNLYTFSVKIDREMIVKLLRILNE